MPFPSLPLGELVTLCDGGSEVVVAPECGARLVAFRVDGRDVLRPTSEAALRSTAAYGFAAFPLLPYSGPIFGGGFGFGGHFHPLARNVAAEPTATHGEGWIRPWRTEAANAGSLVLAMDYLPVADAFPFAWRGRVHFALTHGRLAIRIELVNRDHRPMPAGLGLHPYFPKAASTILRFDCTGVWPPDAPEAAAASCGPIEDGLDFTAGRDVGPLVLDRCFEGWDGVATLTAADGFITLIEADPVFGKLQVYSAWDYPYICIEPVTNANDGFNRAAQDVPCHAMRVLAPGARLAGGITIGAG
jgi:aldose 1-epimerase